MIRLIFQVHIKLVNWGRLTSYGLNLIHFGGVFPQIVAKPRVGVPYSVGDLNGTLALKMQVWLHSLTDLQPDFGIIVWLGEALTLYFPSC